MKGHTKQFIETNPKVSMLRLVWRSKNKGLVSGTQYKGEIEVQPGWGACATSQFEAGKNPPEL